MPACRAVSARHSWPASTYRPGSFELNASARTSTLSSWASVDWTTTTVAGLWSVAPLGGTIVTSRSRLDWAAAPFGPPGTEPLWRPVPSVASRAPTATRAATTTMIPVTSSAGFVTASRPEEPPGLPEDGAVTAKPCHLVLPSHLLVPEARAVRRRARPPGREGVIRQAPVLIPPLSDRCPTMRPLPLTGQSDQMLQRASVGDMRAARRAGTRPATAPINSAAPKPPAHATRGTSMSQPCVEA